MKRKLIIKKIAIPLVLAVSLCIIPHNVSRVNATWVVINYTTMTDADLSPADKALMHEDNWLNNYVATTKSKTLATLTLSDFTSITTLDKGSSSITVIPPSIKFMTNLTNLKLYNNQLTTIPPEIENLTNLQFLNLYKNQLTTIPSEIYNLNKLCDLRLDWNQITTLPPEIGNLTNLVVLNISGNPITIIPPEIGNLVKLRELYLNNSKLTSVPTEIGNLIDLYCLWLSGNQLTSLPSSINNLTRLDNPDFNLGGNYFTSKLPNFPNANYNNNFISVVTSHYDLAFSNISPLTINVGNKIVVSDIIKKTYDSTMSQSVIDQLQVVADDPSIIDSTGEALKSGTTNIRVKLPNNPAGNPSGVTQTSIQVTVPEPEPEALSGSDDLTVNVNLKDTLLLTLTSNTIDFGKVSGISSSSTHLPSNLGVQVKSSLSYDLDLEALDNFTNLDDATALQIPITKLGVSLDGGSYSKFTGVNSTLNLVTSASPTCELGDFSKDYQIMFNLDPTIGFDKGGYSAPFVITATQK